MPSPRRSTSARYYLPGFWRSGLILTTFSLTAFYLSVGATIALGQKGSAYAWFSALVAAILYTSWVYRGAYRVRLSRELFPDYERRLRNTRLLDLFGGPIAGLANWLVFAGSAFGRRLIWRDIHYVLDRHGNVVSVRHQEPPPVPPSRPIAPLAINTPSRPASQTPAGS